MGMQNVQTPWKVLTKPHIVLPYDPVIKLLSIYPKELNICVHKRALERITTNKASGGDGIPAEIF